MFPFMGRAHRRAFRRRAFHRPHGQGPGPGRFGVRRPLRFLIDRLELDESQAAELARTIEQLRLERQQGELDLQRARSTIADLVENEVLDKAALETAAEVRVASARRHRDATVAAMTRLHAALRPDQRFRLSTLLRTGPFDL